MIRVVGANPALDRIAAWPPLRLGEVNRALEASVVPGGKGLNVARAASRMGSTVAVYGFLGGHVGKALREMLLDDGLIDRHVDIAAGTRVCFIAVEPHSERVTVLNEPGPMVTPGEAGRLLHEVRTDCRRDDLLVLSGSLPDSLSPDVAGEIVAIGNDAGACTVVDIHGEALRSAAARRPWMIKCNQSELLGLSAAHDPTSAELDAHGLRSLNELALEMQRVRDAGIAVVVVTLGADGALVADDDGVIHVTAPTVDVVNPTGSGDLLLAGLLVGIERGERARDAITLGVACGTVGAAHLLPELPPGFDPTSWRSSISSSGVEVTSC